MLFGWLLPGHLELLIIAFVALLLFGNRLPSVMRSLGRSVVEFKRGVSGIEDEIQKVGHDQDEDRTDTSKSDAKKGEAEHGHSDAAPQ